MDNQDSEKKQEEEKKEEERKEDEKKEDEKKDEEKKEEEKKEEEKKEDEKNEEEKKEDDLNDNIPNESEKKEENPNKQKYNTIEEYLEKMLYPSLKIAINDLVNEIKKKDYYKELENEFNHNFFRNKAEILQKQKQLLKLERGDDYSEGDYEYWLRQNVDMNESKFTNSAFLKL